MGTQDPESCFALATTSKKKQKPVSNLEYEHLEKTETLQIKLQVVTQSRATATENAVSSLLLKHARKITSLIFQTNIYLDHFTAPFWGKQLCFLSMETWCCSGFHNDTEVRNSLGRQMWAEGSASKCCSIDKDRDSLGLTMALV